METPTAATTRRSMRNAGKRPKYDVDTLFGKFDSPVTEPIIDRKRDSSAVTPGQRQSRGKKRLRRVTQAQTPVGDTSSEDDTLSDLDFAPGDSVVTPGQQQPRGKKRLRRVTQAQTPVGDTSSEDGTPSYLDFAPGDGDDLICDDDILLDTDGSDEEDLVHATEERVTLVKVPCEDKDAIRAFLDGQKTTGNIHDYTNSGSERQNILNALGYQGGFTNWRTVLLSLAASSLSQHHIPNLEAFMEALMIRGPYLAATDVGAFLEQPDTRSWVDDDEEITAEWQNNVCPEIAALAGPALDVHTMSKPSGSIRATLTLVLHYPTFTTALTHGGSTFDPSNPCLHMVKMKIGASRAVKVQDRFMVRHRHIKTGVPWADVYHRWPEMEETFLTFNRFLNANSPILLLVGEQNSRRDNVGDLLDLGPSDEVHWPELKLPGRVNVFQQPPAFGVVRNRVTGVIRHLLFISWHPQRFFYPVQSRMAVYHDLIYNVAAELGRVDTIHESYFTEERARVAIDYPRRNVLNNLRAYEKTATAGLLQEATVRRLLPNLIHDNPHLFPGALPRAEKSGSFVGGVIAVIMKEATRKSATVGSAAGWPNLAKAWAANAAAGWPNLVVNRAVLLARGHPGLITSHANAAAAGYPNLVKGHATMAAQGYPHLKRVHAKLAAAGHPNLAKGHATMAAQGYPQLKRSHAKHKNTTRATYQAKLDAILRTKQVQDLLAKQEHNYAERVFVAAIRAFTAVSPQDWGAAVGYRFRGFLKTKVVLWSPETPTGLRWNGDTCEDPDTFDYSQRHPAVTAPSAP